MKTPTLSPEQLHKMDAYWSATNYLSVGQIYLYDNPLLGRPLPLADVKHRLLGHWGAIDRLPQTGDKGMYLKQQLKEELIEHEQYILKNGLDLPEIRNWKWSALEAAKPEQHPGQP